MQRMRKVRAEISENDSVERFHSFMGVESYLGNAKFVGKHQVEVNGQVLTFRKCTIATGGRPHVPAIPGLDTVPYHTSDTIWNLTRQPRTLLVLGSGPIGCELGQGFQRLGTQVHLLERGSKFLPREDSDAAYLLQEQLQADGVAICLDAAPTRFELAAPPREEGGYPSIRVSYVQGGVEKSVEVEAVLVAAGRRPNVEGIGLEVAGVEVNEEGVKVDNYLKTTNPDIFAVGDCCSSY